jgi:hypothetical protein
VLASPEVQMARLAGALERVQHLYAHDATGPLLELAGVDADALRVFARHCGEAGEQRGTSQAAAFGAGFLIALTLVVEANQ